MGDCNQKPQKRTQRGFTLLELSIVLVIIGLIVGGVSVGAEMIRAAELKGVMRDIRGVEMAIRTFELKYNGAKPGDMKNAQDYWGTTGVLNGDGDGLIGYVGGANYDEAYQFWKHLNESDIFPNQMSGTHTSNLGVVGENTLESSISSVGISSFSSYHGVGYGGSSNDRGNTLMIGKEDGGIATGEFLTPAEAYAIDSKYDDGMPATGNIANTGSINPICADGTTLAATYDLDLESEACSIHNHY